MSELKIYGVKNYMITEPQITPIEGNINSIVKELIMNDYSQQTNYNLI